MSQHAPHPRMHGLTHVPGGPDPIPGLVIGGRADQVIAGTRPGAYYKMGELEGDWHDSTGFGRTMTYVERGYTRGSLSPLDEGEGPAGVPGFPGVCVGVDGGDPGPVKSESNVGEVVDEFFAFAGTDPMTISVLVELAEIPDSIWSMGICGNIQDDVSKQGWGLFVQPKGQDTFDVGTQVRFRRRATDGTIYDVISSMTLMDDPGGDLGGPYAKWVRITGTYDGAVMLLYFNTVLAGVLASTGTLPGDTTHQKFRVGDCGISEGIGGTMAPFNGLIDSVILWDRALSPGEIELIIEASGIGVASINKVGETRLTGNVTLSEGPGIKITQIQNNIEIGLEDPPLADVEIGPPDSAGPGFRTLRIPN